MSEPLRLISHFSQLETLDMSYVLLSLYQADIRFRSPPFVAKAISREWVAGLKSRPAQSPGHSRITPSPLAFPYMFAGRFTPKLGACSFCKSFEYQ